jgi:hypothetical protein
MSWNIGMYLIVFFGTYLIVFVVCTIIIICCTREQRK